MKRASRGCGVSRRTFTVAASTVLSAPYFIPAAALGADAKAPPSERVAVGHIGVGTRGRALYGAFQQVAEAQSVAVADCFASRREATAAACKGKAYADFRDLLADESIDAVVVATPDHWHVPIANAAARAGKDCYVEKPLGLTLAQDLKCLQTFREHDRIFQYGTQQRSMAHCWLGCSLVRAGRVGKVKEIQVVAPNGGKGGSTTPAPMPPGFDYKMWLGPAPDAPYTTDRCRPPGTYWVYDQSIGYLAGWGAHPLDIMVWADDSDLAGPFSVKGTGKIPAEGLYDCVYDWDMTLKMANGVTITFKPGGDSTKFIGEAGWIDVRRKGTTASDPAWLKENPSDSPLVRSGHHAGDFIAAVKSRKDPVSDIEGAVRSDIISQLCDIAVRTGREITWDPKTRTIVGDAEASKLLSRPMRGPWTL